MFEDKSELIHVTCQILRMYVGTDIFHHDKAQDKIVIDKPYDVIKFVLDINEELKGASK